MIQPMPTLETIYALPLEDAIQRTALWRSFMTDFNQQPLHDIPMQTVNSFEVKLQEVIDIVNFPGSNGPQVESIRIYFGLKLLTAESGAQTLVPELVLVGVDAQGNDLIRCPATGSVNNGTFDFAKPCPPTCQANSPLLTGINPCL